MLKILFISLALFVANASAAETDKAENVASVARLLFDPASQTRREALDWIRQRGKLDVMPLLVRLLRFADQDRGSIVDTMEALTGEKHADDWFEWMRWLQAHPDVEPFEGFEQMQADILYLIDPEFKQFIYPDVEHEIRLEEIAWGGVLKDGIPALTNPELISAAQADYLTDKESVFGIEINGDVRAYPLRIMDWHEMFNDVIGGVPVSLAYCTLCGSGILFDTRVEQFDEPLVFGSSGFLYRSNKLMYDQTTKSLWNQFTGRPVVGELTGSGLKLKALPVVITTWGEWKKQHPNTKVLSLDTGFERDYRPGKPYGQYFASQSLMFPAGEVDNRAGAKQQVFGLRISGAKKAWPLKLFRGGKVIHDRVGVIDLVLIGNEKTRTVRAYRAQGNRFNKGKEPNQLRSDKGNWQITETALVGPNGEQLSRLPGHVAYWFAWSNFIEDADIAAE